MSDTKDLKVLIVSSEVTPYAKSGGLGDVIGSLPIELKKHGVDVRVVFPKYKNINVTNTLTYIDYFVVKMDWREQTASIFSIDVGQDEVPMYLIENDYYFARDGFYGYGDDYERFAFFSKASIEFLNNIDFKPDVIHFNDWQTGLGCVYLKNHYSKYMFFKDIKSVFTIHNLQYQGVFGKEILGAVDVRDQDTVGGIEFYNNISYMKAGLMYSDVITTVSEKYAEEIKTQEYGYGMDGILRDRNESLVGILNGIDNVKNNPETDTRIYRNFNKDSLHVKKESKAILQRELGLPEHDVPMISIISRLADQKGLDLVAFSIEELLQDNVQLVVLGTGEGRYEHFFKDLEYRYPDKVSAKILFNADLAQKIYASSDLFLMPSLFEPCGLGQLFAMRYGTVPIVRNTGGLSDTVHHYDRETRQGNGFVFNDYDARGMVWAINEALSVYRDHDHFNQVVRNAMECDFSWSKSAEKYINLYLSLKDSTESN